MVRVSPRILFRVTVWAWLLSLSGCSYQPTPATVLDDVCKAANGASPKDFPQARDREALLALKMACAARAVADEYAGDAGAP